MTTIAYRDGTLSADSMVSYGSFSNGNMNKINIVKMRTGEPGSFLYQRVAVAMSGVCWAIQPMIEWIEGGATQDDIPHSLLKHHTEFSCVMLTADNRLFEFNGGYFIECGVEYHAIGSGAQFALGAMAAGVSAPEAVEASMKHDRATGGTISVFSVADLTLQEAA